MASGFQQASKNAHARLFPTAALCHRYKTHAPPPRTLVEGFLWPSCCPSAHLSRPFLAAQSRSPHTIHLTSFASPYPAPPFFHPTCPSLFHALYGPCSNCVPSVSPPAGQQRRVVINFATVAVHRRCVDRWYLLGVWYRLWPYSSEIALHWVPSARDAALESRVVIQRGCRMCGGLCFPSHFSLAVAPIRFAGACCYELLF